jgi:hypothetical protein
MEILKLCSDCRWSYIYLKTLKGEVPKTTGHGKSAMPWFTYSFIAAVCRLALQGGFFVCVN